MPEATLQEHAWAISREELPLHVDVNVEKIGPYRGYAELLMTWAALTESDACAVRIGQSVGGEALWSLEFGSRSAAKVSVLLAGIHPIEWVGVEACIETVACLREERLENRRIVIFPLVNVDGYRDVERDLRDGRRRFIRGNRRGVDLNRNWPVHFRGPGMATQLGGGRLYGWNNGGSEALSEPEVAAVVGRLDSIARTAQIDRAISLHSIGRRILWPYGGRWRGPHNLTEYQRVATVLGSRLCRRYRVAQTSHWVPGMFARGMELDTLHQRYGALSLLIECSWGGCSAVRPASAIHPFRWFNPPSPMTEIASIARAVGAYLKGGLF